VEVQVTPGNLRPVQTAFNITHRKVLAIAVPIMLSNVSQPLIGVVDTAVIGRLPEPYYIGAVAIASLIFSFLYWGFGFLRLGTSGLTAQAFGANDQREVAAVLCRALLVAIGCGLLLILLGPLIQRLAFGLIEGSAEVEGNAALYFRIRIWSAPFALIDFVLLGWFIGQGRARMVLGLQLFLNLANMALDVLFVLGFGMTTAGVALGTLIAEIAAAGLGCAVIWRSAYQGRIKFELALVFDAEKLKRTFAINFDIMVRTWCLVFALWWHAAQGARQGDVILSANTVLMHCFEVSAYLIDGFAYAAEALVGQAVGAKSFTRYRGAIIITTVWALAVGAILAIAILLAGPQIIDALAVNPEVRQTARIYLPWVALSAVLGVVCFQLDGIFTGATRTRDMRNMMIVSIIVYLISWCVASRALGNHGLWLALNIFFIVRAVTLGMRVPALEQASFTASRPALIR
jgi:multidrug resistance protein, MATE family